MYYMKLLMKLTDDSKQTSSTWAQVDGPPVGTASKILLSCLAELQARLEGEGMPFVLNRKARMGQRPDGAEAGVDEPSSLFAEGSDENGCSRRTTNDNCSSGMLSLQRSVSFILKDEFKAPCVL